ncbi:MAG: DUF1566 domain-containing protein [Magnetococcus sp. YQC-5]
MYSLEDLYNRLNSGADGVKRTGPFTEPAGTPAATGHNLNDIMNKAPLPDNAHGATAADVSCSGVFWGVRTDGTWGQQTGTGTLYPCPPTNAQVSSDQKTISWDPSFGAISYNLYVASQSGLTQDNYTSISGGTRIQNIANPYVHSFNFRTNLKYYVYISAVGSGGAESLLSDPVFVSRFYTNNNGTATDIHTGLILLQNANCFGVKNWYNAMAVAANLSDGQCGLTDRSTPGQWRLPTLHELDVLIPAQNSGLFVGVQPYYYWSSTTVDDFLVNLGNNGGRNKTDLSYIWPLKGGQ